MRMVPYMPLFTTTKMVFAPCWTAVPISCPFIWKQPSPLKDTTTRPGWRTAAETPDGTPLNLWRATPCGDGWVEGLEGTEDLGAEGDKQAGEGFTKMWHGEGEETSAASLGA